MNERTKLEITEHHQNQPQKIQNAADYLTSAAVKLHSAQVSLELAGLHHDAATLAEAIGQFQAMAAYLRIKGARS